MAKLEFYDRGWNARCAGEPFMCATHATRDWRDGWKDCDSVSPSDRVPFSDTVPVKV